MKLAKILASVIEMGLGILFLINGVSDIQIGFGLVLAAIGANYYLTNKEY